MSNEALQITLILSGPPGSGKTHFVQKLVAALGGQFLEIEYDPLFQKTLIRIPFSILDENSILLDVYESTKTTQAIMQGIRERDLSQEKWPTYYNPQTDEIVRISQKDWDEAQLKLAQSTNFNDPFDKALSSISFLINFCHSRSKQAGWWLDPKTGLPQDPKDILITATKLCLVHSEISEAFEGERKGLMDSHLPHRPSGEVELADAVIRIFDLAGAKGYDLGGAILEKMEYNLHRADHKIENRVQDGGKRC
jgi:hypothetical protein